MRTLPPPTRSLMIIRQLSTQFDSHKLVGLSAAQRTIVITRLANVLMAAAGIVTEESRYDEQ
ncbi:hypothetical protein [Mesorhizobium sp. NZP2234]|uniref:hypothetical protein n=1 Tax=Mesorhizobium sp. NZP2234 TaxID=2483402 RepID=UPI00155328B7|nr:hypothetical protein [Mesorhizobium sp. NZP2234]